MARAEAGRAEAGARADRTAERGKGAAVVAEHCGTADESCVPSGAQSDAVVALTARAVF